MPALKREDQIDQQYQDKLETSGLRHAEEEAGVNAGIDQLESYANDPNNSTNTNRDAVKNSEESTLANSDRNGFYRDNSSNTAKQGFAKRSVNFLRSKKGGATAGIVGGGGIIFALLSTLFGPFTLLHNLQANADATNNSRTSVLERRLLRSLEKKMNTSPGDTCNIKNAKCRMGKIPNRMVYEMSRQGIKAFDASGNEIKADKSRRDYLATNPTEYEYTDRQGAVKRISNTEFINEYKNNPYFKGTFKKAFNMGYRGQTGKFLNKVFYKKYGIKQNGGLASDKELNTENAREKFDAEAKQNPPSDAKNEVTKKATDKMTKSAKRAARTGDPILMASAAGCVAVNTPKTYANVVRGLQMAKLLALFPLIVDSPGGMAKAGEISPEQMAALGLILTETVSNRAAVDSPILQSGIGVNKNKIKPSESFVPGLSVFNSPAVRASSSISGSTEEACDLVMSPQASVASAAISAASTATGPGALVYAGVKAAAWTAIKLKAADLLISAAGTAASLIAGKLCEQYCDELIKNYANNLEGAKGEKLGDALGTSLFAYYSMRGSAGGNAVLSKTQNIAFSQVIAETNNDQRLTDLATLSPFDTSSRYTFLGGIVNNLAISGVSSDNPIRSLAALTTAKPFELLTPSSSAAAPKHDYSDMFNVKNAAMTPAGTPYTGIPTEYLGMSTDDVYDLATSEDGECQGDDGCELINTETGEVTKEDSELADVLSTCSEPDLDELDGCIIQSGTGFSGTRSLSCSEVENASEDCQTDNSTVAVQTTDGRKSASRFLFTIDQQVENILNGNDDIETEESSSTSSAGATFANVTFPLANGKSTVTNPNIFKDGTTNRGGHPYTAFDILAPAGTEVLAFTDGVVTKVHSGSLAQGLSIYNEATGLNVYYTHMIVSSSITVGMTVTPGQPLGKLASVKDYPGINADHLHIDASTGRIRGACSRSSCSIQDSFRDIGPDLFKTWEAQ